VLLFYFSLVKMERLTKKAICRSLAIRTFKGENDVQINDTTCGPLLFVAIDPCAWSWRASFCTRLLPRDPGTGGRCGCRRGAVCGYGRRAVCGYGRGDRCGYEETVAVTDEETVAVTDEETATVTDEESSVETSPIPFDWIEFANREAGTLNTLTIKEIEYRFRWCPAGEFMMGSPTYEEGRNNDEQQHKVRLTNGFWIMETEVTQEMWESVMDDNPSFFKDPHFPVERVSWHDCQKFIMRLNAEGHPPFGLVFALPTEAQWEYACRAGTTSAFSFGDTIDGAQSNVMGFYPKDAPKTERDLGQTSDVKKYPPNPWGLYDMHGNVWEWCHDRYGSFKFDEDVVLADPEGAFLGEKRVLRGGAWNYGAESSRSAAREARHPESIWHCLSLRCVLVPLKK
jgi:sulfatase modifying factor 1